MAFANECSFSRLTRRGAAAGLRAVAFLAFLPLALSAQILPPVPSGLISGQAASLVLGQKNYSDITPGTSQQRWGAISGIAVAGNRLIVADGSYLAPPNNNRVLIYNDLNSLLQRLPQSDLPNADVVVGQPDFTTSTPGTSATTLSQPSGVATDGTRLFIADWANNRVLIYNTIPTQNGAAADVVVGQPNFTSATNGTGAAGLRRPNSVATDGTRLFIADTLNNRVLIYNTIPTQNGAAANIALGQPNLDSRLALPTAANTLSDPMAVTTDGTRLIVTDFGNNRVLIYNHIPTQSGALADVVVGQPDFTSNSAGNTSTKLNFPRYAYSDGTRLLITDSGNNRILIYNSIPTQNGAAADVVIGQQNFESLMESCASSNFAVPFMATATGGTLLVSDGFNRRVLGFRPGADLVRAVVNAASFSDAPQTAACDVILLQPPVAPGGIVSIFGTGLADSTRQADSLPLPTSMEGVRVLFNGIPAALFYVSPNQINVQVPYDLTGYSASMQIEKTGPSGTILSTAFPVGVANGAPGIFTRDGTTDGPGLVFHADFSPVTEDNPAKPGETLVTFATGLGTVDQPIATGEAAQFKATGSVSVGGVSTVAGQTVTVTVNGRDYSYNTASDDLIATVLSRLSDMINNADPEVEASVDSENSLLTLKARTPGDQGANISFSASATGALSAGTSTLDIVPGSITFSGTPVPGQTITVTLAGQSNFAYTVQPGDTIASIINALVARIEPFDPNVSAAADLDNNRLLLTLRDGNSGLSISYAVSIDSVAPFIASVEGTGSVPGNVLIGGGPAIAGQRVSIILGGTEYTYTVQDGDTPADVIGQLIALINRDPNVAASGNSDTSELILTRRDDLTDPPISLAARVVQAPHLVALTASHFLTPGLGRATNTVSGVIGQTLPIVPGDIQFFGTPQEGQVVTVNLSGTQYQYSVKAGDTLQTITTALAEMINNDPNVTTTTDLTVPKISLALKDPTSKLQVTFAVTINPTVTTLFSLTSASQTTGSEAVGITFAGLVKGFAGLYQINFTVPSDAAANPQTKLTFSQNLIVFGSVTNFNIFSNTVTFPVGTP